MVGVAVTEMVGVTVTEIDGVTEMVGVTVAEIEGVTEIVGVAVMLGVGVGVTQDLVSSIAVCLFNSSLNPPLAVYALYLPVVPSLPYLTKYSKLLIIKTHLTYQIELQQLEAL